MQVFMESLSGVLVILGMILVGYCLTEHGWFKGDADKLIAKLVTQVSLPCYMLSTITGKFKAHELLEMLPDLRFPVLSMMILMAIAFALVRIFNIRKGRQGLFTSMFFNSNTIFVGLPINQALFGDRSIPYVLIYYMANTTIFWTLGTFFIQRDGEKGAKFDLKKTLGKVFSPPLLGFMLGIVLVLIGISVSHAGLAQMSLKKDNLLILFGRFVCAPLLMTVLVIHAPMPTLMKHVFILQSAMPVMTNAPVVANLYGADSSYAAVMVTETTLMSLIVVPILMVIMQSL